MPVKFSSAKLGGGGGDWIGRGYCASGAVTETYYILAVNQWLQSSGWALPKPSRSLFWYMLTFLELIFISIICTHTAYSRRSRVPFLGTRMDEFSDQVNVKLFSLFSKGRAPHYTYQTLFLWNVFFVTDEYARPYNGLQRFPYADIRMVFAVFVKFVE